MEHPLQHPLQLMELQPALMDRLRTQIPILTPAVILIPPTLILTQMMMNQLLELLEEVPRL